MEQLELFPRDNTPPISLEDVFAAYYECRKNKRRTINALKFEMNLEEKLVQLWRELNDGTYQIGKSIAFIVKRPVKREVFAADFRDRIVHHLVIRKLWPILNKAISPHSYSCRPGMGTLYGIRQVYNYVKKCSNNYTQDCYVLKLDIRAFFMHIRHDKLYQMLAHLIRVHYFGPDKEIILRVVKQIITNRPQNNCIIKGSYSDWRDLPKAKSLFYAKRGQGLPIGNLSSQIFANFYLNAFDSFVAGGVNGMYGRYVDDMILIHKNKHCLMTMLTKVKQYLKSRYNLILHPKKIRLQHYNKGFGFIGAFLLPGRMYAGRRLKLMFYAKIKLLVAEPVENALSVINSYFGFLRHYSTLHLRLKGWQILQSGWPWFYLDRFAVKVFSP